MKLTIETRYNTDALAMFPLGDNEYIESEEFIDRDGEYYSIVTVVVDELNVAKETFLNTNRNVIKYWIEEA